MAVVAAGRVDGAVAAYGLCGRIRTQSGGAVHHRRIVRDRRTHRRAGNGACHGHSAGVRSAAWIYVQFHWNDAQRAGDVRTRSLDGTAAGWTLVRSPVPFEPQFGHQRRVGCRCRAGDSGRPIHRGQYDCRGHTYSNEGLPIGDRPRRIARSISPRRFRGPSDDDIALSRSWKLSPPSRVGYRDGGCCVGITALAFTAHGR